MLFGKYIEKRIFEFETKLGKDKFSIKKARGLTLAFHVIIKVSCINIAYLIVTNSSAAVGWIATVSSKSFFVAPIFSATAKPCSISSMPKPIP